MGVEQWERFEVIQDKERACARAHAHARSGCSQITEAALAAVFSAEGVEEWETACLFWASLTVKLEE